MSEERERILTLLEQGKINADQAARLIEALGHASRPEPPEPPAWPRRPRRVLAGDLDRIPDIVAEAVASAVKSGAWPKEGEVRTEFKGKNNLFLKSVSGDVELAGWDQDRVSLEGLLGGMVRVRERGDQVMVRSISGDVQGKVPAESRLELSSVSGNVTVRGIKGKFGLRSVSGDVSLTDFSGELDLNVVSGEIELIRVSGTLAVDSKSGDIEMEPVGEFSGEVVSKSGDIEVRLQSSADVVLEMECEVEGEIAVRTGFGQETLEQGERSARVRFGPGSRVLKLRTRKANITVKEAKEEQVGTGQKSEILNEERRYR